MKLVPCTAEPTSRAPARLRAALSALCLAAASPAWAASPTPPAQDSQGAPVRGATGACVETDIKRAAQSGPCAEQRQPATWRVLQNMIPQPYVTYSDPPPPPPAETVRFAPSTGFGVDQAAVVPALRDELIAFLATLERYQRIEKVEVLGHDDGNPRPAYGQWLAGKRAESVRNWLIARGITSTMVEGRAAPEADPALRGRFELRVTVRGRR